jgi:hypothetical protein
MFCFGANTVLFVLMQAQMRFLIVQQRRQEFPPWADSMGPVRR